MSDVPPATVQAPATEPGWTVFSRDAHQVGTVDAVFADYLLVRTSGLIPVDLYVPVTAVTAAGDRRVIVDADAHETYGRWHRPLKRAPHD
jgi:hypothetical protein